MSEDTNQQTARALGVTVVKAEPATKAEQRMIDASMLSVEDAFEEHYFDPTGKAKGKLVRPPYDMYDLESFLQGNNALNQCITAYEVNIDGTGWEIVPSDENEDNEPNENEINAVADFFNEPNPRESFVTMRRQVRRDTEATGNGYMEVIRTAEDEIAFVRRADAKTIRLAIKSDAVPVKITMKRGGKDMSVTVNMRERAYAQKIGTKIVYYKEFGASRDLNKETGEWSDNGRLPVELRASELIHFVAQPDTKTGYGIPRWINQLPSVLGSRKAEELNLDFFNSGGLPPALIILQGGSMTEEVRKNLNAYLSGKGSSKNRAAIVETTPSGGSLDHAGSVRVTVERFGSERQQDSMFENYDEKSEKRVRSAFRLPPLFVGRTDDYTFASAFASYMVAEAQVFSPERSEFDERINVTLMKELDPDGEYEYRSLPLSIKNTENQLKAIEILANKGKIDDEELIDTINEVTNMDIEFHEIEEEEPPTPPPGTPPVDDKTGTGSVTPTTPSDGSPAAPPTPAAPASKADGIDTIELVHLAGAYAGMVTGEIHLSKEERAAVQDRIRSLGKMDKERFDAYVTLKAMGGGYDNDPEGAVELCSCASEILASDDH